jgi:SRSO17 transposase
LRHPGKIANCQVAVSLHWSSAQASCPLVWRLYLPQPWLADAARAHEVRLAPGMVYQSKTELALEAIDQALAWGLPPWPVLADHLSTLKYWRLLDDELTTGH